jgi:putative N6-adenine-specific DNA methylase
MDKLSEHLELFAISSPGLEPYTEQELRDLGHTISDPINDTRQITSRGGVPFIGNLRAIYHSNLHLRTSNRVLVRLGTFYAAAFSELRKKASRLPWEHYLTPGQSIAIRASCHKSRLYHSGAVAERVAGAIADSLGKPARVTKFSEQNLDEPTQLILVRIVRDQCTISIDSSGALLHQRGYRLTTARAPLRETLAAGLLYASEWDPSTPLIDPFCGSGTIAIEAAMLAHGIAPGSRRSFAFMQWPKYDEQLWQELLENAKLTQNPTIPTIMASDRDAGAINTAETNAKRAGVAETINFSHQPISAIQPHGVGWVVTNPPYGRRISQGKDLRNLYAQLGNILRAKCPGWQVGILSDDLKLLSQTRLLLDTSLSFDNGGIHVRLGRGTVPGDG